MNDWEITVQELKKKLDAGETPFILDVREPNEYQINRIAGSTLIPLGEIPRRYAELNPEDELIMFPLTLAGLDQAIKALHCGQHRMPSGS